MIEVWGTQGQGGVKIAEFVSFKEAYTYVEEHKGEMSFAIKFPSGAWYEWGDYDQGPERQMAP